MSWPRKEDITQGVIDMLKVNMNFKDSEKLLVVSDVPRLEDWLEMEQSELQETLERVALGRLVGEIAQEQFPDATVEFFPFPATGGHGTEPDEKTAAKMREPDVLLCLTRYSLSHTNAREAATSSGARVASMPGFTHEMLAPGGPMAVDHNQMAVDCQRFADLMTAAEEVHIRTPHGTDLRFSLKGRKGNVDHGLYQEVGTWGNLPAGESYAAPLEGTGEGRLVVPAGWFPGLKEEMVLTISKGLVVSLEGGGKVGDDFRGLLDFESDDPIVLARRNIAELGIGTNPNARRPDNVLEAEKIMGTVHVAIGDSSHMGGVVEADLHEDFILPEAELIFDGKTIIRDGEWL